MPRTRTQTRDRPSRGADKTKQANKDTIDEREVWPMFVLLLRAMISSWFLYSVYDRFLREGVTTTANGTTNVTAPSAWTNYMHYQRECVLHRY